MQLAKLVYTSLLGPPSQTPQGVQLTAPVLTLHPFLIRDLHTQTPDPPGYLLFFKYVPYSFSFHCLNEVTPTPHLCSLSGTQHLRNHLHHLLNTFFNSTSRLPGYLVCTSMNQYINENRIHVPTRLVLFISVSPQQTLKCKQLAH